MTRNTPKVATADKALTTVVNSDKNTASVRFQRVLDIARMALGFIIAWAFVDKLFGLGFSTCRSADTNLIQIGCTQSWLAGGSPTAGFLTHGTSGPFADVFQSLAGNTFVDWLFMLGLLLIGTALLLGIGVRVAAVSGSVLMATLWLSMLPPANNPLIDEHIIYISLLILIGLANDSQQIGLGKYWRRLGAVKKHRFLK